MTLVRIHAIMNYTETQAGHSEKDEKNEQII